MKWEQKGKKKIFSTFRKIFWHGKKYQKKNWKNVADQRINFLRKKKSAISTDEMGAKRKKKIFLDYQYSFLTWEKNQKKLLSKKIFSQNKRDQLYLAY